MKKVIDIKGVKLVSINQKYGKNPKTGALYLSREYRDMKKLLTMAAKKGRIDPPYKVLIEFDSYIDIDNPIKVIQDSLQEAGIINDDKNVLSMFVMKRPIPKNSFGNLTVHVGQCDNPTM